MLLFNLSLYNQFISYLYFNTSNVTIQRMCEMRSSTYRGISIHLMLLFNKRCLCLICCITVISIHLMLLFTPLLVVKIRGVFCISIHLMLLFNEVIVPSRTLRQSISIHLMLLFNVTPEMYYTQVGKFQYI